jgi:hypothetical protein
MKLYYSLLRVRKEPDEVWYETLFLSYISQQDFPSASIVIEAIDDAGGVGVGRVSF